MAPIDYQMQHSVAVLRQLAQEGSRTPPPQDGPTFEYIDRSLAILGRSSEIHSQSAKQ